MKQFFSIILRNQFNLFYRFGYTFIPTCHLIDFEDEVTEEVRNKIISLFLDLTPFEWDEEYLIIQLENNTLSDNPIRRFEIQDLLKVFPLSSQAKASIENKIDARIRLEKPIFEDLLPTIVQHIEKNEIEKAIEALWQLCEIPGDLKSYVSNIGMDNILKGLERRRSGTKSNQIYDGNYWEYVLAYDRYDYFPNSIIGYFYDAGQIFAFSKGLPSFDGSGVSKTLENLNKRNPNAKMREIIELLENEELAKGYVAKTSSGNLFQYVITPLYLMLRDEIRKSDDLYQTNLLKHLNNLKEFGDNFNYAIVLLGGFFGFRKFYDIYYDKLDLRFYKSFGHTLPETETNEKNSTVEIITTINQLEEVQLQIDDPKKSASDLSNKTANHIDHLFTKEDSLNVNAGSGSYSVADKATETDNLRQYKDIIYEVIANNKEVKIKILTDAIKEKTQKKSFKNENVIKIIESMKDLEIINKKNVRYKPSNDLFDDQQ